MLFCETQLLKLSVNEGKYSFTFTLFTGLFVRIHVYFVTSEKHDFPNFRYLAFFQGPLLLFSSIITAGKTAGDLTYSPLNRYRVICRSLQHCCYCAKYFISILSTIEYLPRNYFAFVFEVAFAVFIHEQVLLGITFRPLHTPCVIVESTTNRFSPWAFTFICHPAAGGIGGNLSLQSLSRIQRKLHMAHPP